jgi:electron transport complex protein RnfE
MAQEFIKGIWKENPALVQLLGMCPTLAVTTSAANGMGMGLATTFVLVMSSAIVSLVKKIFSPQVRIVGYITIIATFVTFADLFLKAYFFGLSRQLGPYVPLIVVNCVILGRQEAFASKNNIVRSVVDALGMGAGFTLALVVLGMFRELLGAGEVFGITLLGQWFTPWLVMIMPAGAFFGFGIMLAVKHQIDKLSNGKSA